MVPSCDTYWGSHGCDLPEGHRGLHMCGTDDDGPDSYCDGSRVIMYNYYEETWSDWYTTTVFHMRKEPNA